MCLAITASCRRFSQKIFQEKVYTIKVTYMYIIISMMWDDPLLNFYRVSGNYYHDYKTDYVKCLDFHNHILYSKHIPNILLPVLTMMLIVKVQVFPKCGKSYVWWLICVILVGRTIFTTDRSVFIDLKVF